MYKVFVNDKPIILTSEISEDKLYKTYPLKYVDLPRVIRSFRKSANKGVYLYHKDEDKLLKKFLKKFPNVIAGGGKVYNSVGKVLFIYRNDKWDLPKGKVESGESIELGAIREVEKVREEILGSLFLPDRKTIIMLGYMCMLRDSAD